jgi:hypothetical protein
MKDALYFVPVVLLVLLHLMPADMRKDFWNMLWKKDSPDD